MLSHILVELPWDFLCAFAIYITWYYPTGAIQNAEASGATHERGILMFLLLLAFLVFASTFAIMAMAAVDTAENGGTISNLVYVLVLMFCG